MSELEADDASMEDVVGVVGARVREIRTGLRLSLQKLADEAGISRAMLFKIEHGQAAASIQTLSKVARAADIPLTALFRGLDEEHDGLLVRAGKGIEIAHRDSGTGRRYQDLGSLRGASRAIEPVLITITERDEVFPLFQHPGVEMLYIVCGVIEYSYGSNTYTLHSGDTLQMRGEVSHGPARLIELPVQFLSLKVHDFH